MAAAWKLEVEAGTLRRELVELLAARIVDEAAKGVTWSGLGETERSVIRQLVRAGGRHEADLLTRRLGRAALHGRSPDQRPAQIEGSISERIETAVSERIERAVSNLVERGLLFRVFDGDEQRRGVYLILADEVLTAARQSIDAGSDGEVVGVGGRPEPLVHRPEWLVERPKRVARSNLTTDLFILASALRREAWGAASRDLAGRPARTVGQIVGRLRQLPGDGPGDPSRRWRFLLWLSQRAGWLSRGTWPTPDDAVIERLLADPGGLPGLALRAGPVESGGGRAARQEQADARRRQADALQVLSELEVDQWTSATDLVAWLASELAGPVPRPGDGRAGNERRRLKDQLRRWLTGRWFWLGLVAWGSNGDGWDVVAPTEAPRSLTTGRTAAPRQSSRRCTVTGPLQLEAQLDADLAVLYRAERYLALAGGDLDWRRYGLTPASFDRGVRLGGDPEELRALLGRLLDGPIPLEWLDALDAWSNGSSRLTLSARLVLVGDRAETLAAALAVAAARAAVAETVSKRHALVDGARVAELLTELARAGLPVEIDPGLRVEARDIGRSAGLASGVAATAWVALEVLRRLAPEAVAEQRDLQSARARLDAVLGASVIEALSRRAAAIVTAIANRRRPRARRPVV